MENQKRPAVVTGAFIFNSRNQIFLFKSPKWGNRWVIPGGHVESGEDVVTALRREVKEETNLEITDIQFIGYLDMINPPDFYKPKHFLGLNFFCRTTDTNVIINEEATEYAWVDLDQTEKYDVAIPSKKIIKLIKTKNYV